MKKLYLVVLLACSITTLLAQGCLPDGIVFTNQAQINSFNSNYPGCTQILGDVRIQGTNITNLNGLSGLNSIGGGLFIIFNDALTSFTGLDNIITVGGGLTLDYNNLITNMNGLGNLSSVGGGIRIGYNVNLVSLSGLESLTYIGGVLLIEQNENLASLSGINNITAGSIYDLTIKWNISLSNCEVQSVCDYLADPDAIAEISYNLTGCNSRTEVENSCNNPSTCLPDGITFLTQMQVDSFQYNYPGCTTVEGDVIINASNITDLSGLNILNSIGRDLIITNNWTLSSLYGLENLISIGRDLYLINNELNYISGLNNLNQVGRNVEIGNFYFGGNPNLSSLTGLEGLNTIGGVLRISSNGSLHDLTGLNNLISVDSALNVSWNQSLYSLAGLEGLTSIGGSLSISDNDSLVSIAGIENINSGSITNLTIYSNKLLSTCEVQSVCNYLAAPNGTIEISQNAEGCNTQNQVNDACLSLGVENNIIESAYSIFPNPSHGVFTINFAPGYQTHVELAVFNSMGQLVVSLFSGQLIPVSYHKEWDSSGLPAGVYYCRLRVGDELVMKKMVKIE